MHATILNMTIYHYMSITIYTQLRLNSKVSKWKKIKEKNQKKLDFVITHENA